MSEVGTLDVAAVSRGTKSAQAYRTIKEVADELGVATHVLRFWETKFKELKPMKQQGGRRFYRPEDIALLRQIKTMLYDEGYTIRGVQAALKKKKKIGEKPEASSVLVSRKLVSELQRIRQILN